MLLLYHKFNVIKIKLSLIYIILLLLLIIIIIKHDNLCIAVKLVFQKRLIHKTVPSRAKGFGKHISL